MVGVVLSAYVCGLDLPDHCLCRVLATTYAALIAAHKLSIPATRSKAANPNGTALRIEFGAVRTLPSPYGRAPASPPESLYNSSRLVVATICPRPILERVRFGDHAPGWLVRHLLIDEAGP